MKILICDYTGVAEKWLDNFTIKKNYEVVGTLTPTTDKNLLSEKNWDYVLIFEQGLRNFFEPLILFMNIEPERVIYALDIKSWLEHPAAIFALLNPNGGGAAFYRHLSFGLGRQLNHYISCTTSTGLNYIATSKDNILIRYTYTTCKNWAEDDMHIFHELANKFYQIDDSSGLFLDLGANIGTTGIYFLKKLTPNLKLLAFEPDPENFKLLRANLILNDLEEKTTAENYGLGLEESEETMYLMAGNPGGNSVFIDWFDKKNTPPSETIKIISLDKYFEEKNLNAEDIKYIWIDTQGSEAQILLGAKKILRQKTIPIFVEFNPHIWQKSGFYEKFMELLQNFYTDYIFFPLGYKSTELELQPISKLWEYQNANRYLGDLFLIKKS